MKKKLTMNQAKKFHHKAEFLCLSSCECLCITYPSHKFILTKIFRIDSNKVTTQMMLSIFYMVVINIQFLIYLLFFLRHNIFIKIKCKVSESFRNTCIFFIIICSSSIQSKNYKK